MIPLRHFHACGGLLHEGSHQRRAEPCELRVHLHAERRHGQSLQRTESQSGHGHLDHLGRDQPHQYPICLASKSSIQAQEEFVVAPQMSGAVCQTPLVKYSQSQESKSWRFQLVLRVLRLKAHEVGIVQGGRSGGRSAGPFVRCLVLTPPTFALLLFPLSKAYFN